MKQEDIDKIFESDAGITGVDKYRKDNPITSRIVGVMGKIIAHTIYFGVVFGIIFIILSVVFALFKWAIGVWI